MATKRKKTSEESQESGTGHQPEINCDFGKTVTVLVGRDPKSIFTIHKHVLVQSAPFFEAAMGPNWMRDDSEAIELPDDEAEVFNAFAAWAYTGQVLHPPRVSGAATGKDVFNHRIWIKLYVFADKVQAINLKNATITKFYDNPKLVLKMTPEDCRFLWSIRTSGSHLQALVASLWANHAAKGTVSLDMVTQAPIMAERMLHFLMKGAKLDATSRLPLSSFLDKPKPSLATSRSGRFYIDKEESDSE